MSCRCPPARSPRRIITKALRLSPICSKASAQFITANLQKRVLVRQGEQCFVAADMPHAPRNESGNPCTWIVVHSSGSDQDGIVLLPEFDAKLAQRIGAPA